MKTSVLVLCFLGTVAVSSAVTCPSIVGYVADPDNSETYFMCLFYKPIQRSCGSGNVFDVESRNCRPVVQFRQGPPIFTTRFPTMPPIVTTPSTEGTGEPEPTTEGGETSDPGQPTPSVITTSSERPTPPLITDLPTPPVVTVSTARPTPPLITDGTTAFPTPPLITVTTDQPTIVPPMSTTEVPLPPVSTTRPVVPISTTLSTIPSLPVSTTDATPPNPHVSTTPVPGPDVSTTTPGIPISTTTQAPTCPTCPVIVCPPTGIHRYHHSQFCNRFYLCVDGVFHEMNCPTGDIFDHATMICSKDGVCHINAWMFD